MRRRGFTSLLAGTALGWPLVAQAQRPARLALIVNVTAAQARAGLFSELREGLRENGLAEGTDYVLEPYFADGDYDRFPALMQAALARQPTVLLMIGSPAVLAAQQATKSVPIVFMATNDPVGTGLIASLARPGGNTTGTATMADEYTSKLVEFIRDTLPQARRLAVLFNPANPSNRAMMESVWATANAAGFEAKAAELEAPARLDAVFAAVGAGRPDALLVVPDVLTISVAGKISALAMSQRIGVFADSVGFVEAGALLGYGPSRPALIRRAAWYVKKILAGAHPRDLPVERPTKFELRVNLKTAKALGLAIPPLILARADEVIE